MARILIEGNHDDLAKEIGRLMGLSVQEIQLTHDARLSLMEGLPRILLLDYFGSESTQKDLLKELRSKKIPFIALIAKGRYWKREQGQKNLLAREAMELGAVGVFYTDCHKSIYCLEEMVRRIKEIIFNF